MRVQYQLSADDFWQSTLAWRRARSVRRWSYRILPASCFLLLGLSLASAWRNPEYRRSLPLLAVGALWIAITWARPRLNARRRASTPPNERSINLEVLDPGLHFVSAIEDSLVAWPAFVGWGEGKAVFTLFPSTHTCIPIPKRAFTAEQLDEFREILGP